MQLTGESSFTSTTQPSGQALLRLQKTGTAVVSMAKALTKLNSGVSNASNVSNATSFASPRYGFSLLLVLLSWPKCGRLRGCCKGKRKRLPIYRLGR